MESELAFPLKKGDDSIITIVYIARHPEYSTLVVVSPEHVDFDKYTDVYGPFYLVLKQGDRRG